MVGTGQMSRLNARCLTIVRQVKKIPHFVCNTFNEISPLKQKQCKKKKKKRVGFALTLTVTLTTGNQKHKNDLLQ